MRQRQRFCRTACFGLCGEFGAGWASLVIVLFCSCQGPSQRRSHWWAESHNHRGARVLRRPLAQRGGSCASAPSVTWYT